MLAVSSYDRKYVKECRTQINDLIKSWKSVAAEAGDKPADDFEPKLFNNLVLSLDHYFLHRQRGLEKKDGNPLNEVRVLCVSIMENGGTMSEDKTIRMKPENTVLGYAVGDRIEIDLEGFERLSKAFFDEIEIKYP